MSACGSLRPRITLLSLGRPTAELADELDIEPSLFARQMGELGCRPTRHYVPTERGTTRRVRGYLTTEIRVALERATTNEIGSHAATPAG